MYRACKIQQHISTLEGEICNLRDFWKHEDPRPPAGSHNVNLEPLPSIFKELTSTYNYYIKSKILLSNYVIIFIAQPSNYIKKTGAASSSNWIIPCEIFRLLSKALNAARFHGERANPYRTIPNKYVTSETCN